MRRLNRNNDKVELLVYLRAFPLLVMNPIVLLAPLLAAILDQVLIATFRTPFTSLIIFLLDTFALAVSIIVADMVWRRGKASFDEAWDDARRKAGDILLAGIGLNFVLFVAKYAGDIVSPYAGYIGMLIALVFLIYTVPAAAISGVPGSLALQKSIDLVKPSPINAVILTVVALGIYFFVGGYLPAAYLDGFGTVTLVLEAACKALALGYVSFIMAQRFATQNLSAR